MQNVHMQQQEILYFHIYNTHTHFFNVRNLSSTLSASINDPTQCYQLQLPYNASDAQTSFILKFYVTKVCIKMCFPRAYQTASTVTMKNKIYSHRKVKL